MGKNEILQALDFLNPADLDYNDWLHVGMALQAEGFSCTDWDNWSRREKRYKEGDCAKRWKGFSGSKVTGGTIIELAKNRGWKVPQNENAWIGYIEQCTKEKFVKRYDLYDVSGKYHHSKIRLMKPDGSKDFRTGWIEDGKFTFSNRNKRALETKGTLYGNMRAIKKAIIEGRTIYIPEGEKDVDTLTTKGYPAISYGSCTNWDPKLAPFFDKANVIILADNDRDGFKVAKQVKSDLLNHAESVKIVVPYPDVESGDVSDFFDGGGAVEWFDCLCDSPEQKLDAFEDNSLPVGNSSEKEMQEHESENDPDQIQIEFINASELDQMELPPIRCIVHNLIVEGLNIIASPPKFGKSWLCIDLGLSVATGTHFLGFNTEQCGVLYLALEDGKSRLQSRARKIAGNRTIPSNFYYVFEAPPLDHGLLDQLEKFIQEHSDIGLIIIDTFQLIRSGSKKNESAYSADYRETHQLKRFADSHHIAILLVHHLRKMIDPSDAFANVSGTTGITGAADTSIILTRENRTDENTTLSITGRDILMQELSAKFDKESCRWSILGEKDILEEARKKERYEQNSIVRTVKALLDQNKGCWEGTVKDIVEASNYLESPIFSSLQKIGKDLQGLTEYMYRYDSILHEETSHGTGGKKHRFYYQQDENNPFTDNLDFIDTESTAENIDPKQIALPLGGQ